MTDFPGNRVNIDGDDDVLMRVRATLAPLPAPNPQAVARVLAAVHGRAPVRRGVWQSWRGFLASLRLSPVMSIAGGTIVVATIASIAIVRGYAPGASGALVVPSVASATSVTAPATAPATAGAVGSGAGGNAGAMIGAAGTPSLMPAGTDGDPEAAMPVQFVLDAAGASSVSVAGDFNDWNASASPMQRLPGSGLWTVTLAVQPGRHLYSFVIDGARWVADPRAPRAVDSDFGKPGSVLLVNSR